MTSPLTITINEEAEARLRRAAQALGESPEEFAARALSTRLDAFEQSAFFARRRDDFDREAALKWLDAEAAKDAPATDDDVVPPDFERSR